MPSKTLKGTFTVTVDGNPYELKPTLGAVRAIEARHSGLLQAARACDAMSVDAIAQVIAAGAGLTGQDAESVPEQVFQEGVVSAYGQVVPYLKYLMNPRAGEAKAEGNGEAAAAKAP